MRVRSFFTLWLFRDRVIAELSSSPRRVPRQVQVPLPIHGKERVDETENGREREREREKILYNSDATIGYRYAAFDGRTITIHEGSNKKLLRGVLI